jgi:4-diphosphocytidyl-2-C-methyl-D-erythritol kinase
MGGEVELAKAKINLALHILGRRPDGYHELDTLVVFAELGDRLRVEPGDDLQLSVVGRFAAEIEGENLVLRAARKFFAAAGRETPPLHFVLDKVLPVAAGLGGGSADAAACLRLLGRLFPGLVARDAVERLALSLGADVPMCLRSTAQRVGGAGERLSAVEGMPRLPLVLVNPGVAVATKAVFAELELPPTRPLPAPPSMKGPAELAAWLRQTRNDLAEPAKRLAPIIGESIAALESHGRCLFARMSGSGATCFGLYATDTDAAAAAETLRKARPGWWIEATAAGG